MTATISQTAPGASFIPGVVVDGLDGSTPPTSTVRSAGEQRLSPGIPPIVDALDGSDGLDGSIPWGGGSGRPTPHRIEVSTPIPPLPHRILR